MPPEDPSFELEIGRLMEQIMSALMTSLHAADGLATSRPPHSINKGFKSL